MGNVFVVTSQTMGSGDDELGTMLIASFFRKLAGSETKPEQIIFYNEGVKLLADGSRALDGLILLAEAGVDLVACGTCVEFFELGSRLKVGRVGAMQGIVAALSGKGCVVTI